MAKRIYVVEGVEGSGVPVLKLVNAGNISQAIRHVASKTMSARVASQGDLVKLLATCQVEEVSADELKE